MKLRLSVVTACIVMLALSAGALALWLTRNDERNARRECAAVQAEPVRVGSGRYLCVTSDGRVVKK